MFPCLTLPRYDEPPLKFTGYLNPAISKAENLILPMALTVTAVTVTP